MRISRTINELTALLDAVIIDRECHRIEAERQEKLRRWRDELYCLDDAVRSRTEADMALDDAIRSTRSSPLSRPDLMKVRPVEGCARLAMMAIGERLAVEGGRGLMRHVRDQVRKRRGNRATILDRAWVGIDPSWTR